MKSAFEPSSTSVLRGVSINSSSSSQISCSWVSSVHNDLAFIDLDGGISTPFDALDRLSLLPNRTNCESHHHLHLLVHGSRGGEIHSSLISLVDQLKRYKNRSVSIEALTQENPPQLEIGNKSMFLVPLFLLPGTHVCTDVPKIFKRFQDAGNNIKLFPFLGSFHPWLSLIGDWIRNQKTFHKPALIHHPVSTENSSVFLRSLENVLNTPFYSWSIWNRDIFDGEKKYFPIPYLLTPNKNIEIDNKGEQLKSLLEIEVIHRGLVELLGNLP